MKKRKIENQHLTSVHKLNWFVENWKSLTVIIFSIAIVYGQTIKFDFINYDDDKMVYNNSTFLEDIENIPKSFTQSVFASQGDKGIFYRPLLLTSYILDYQVWKLQPVGYHLTNILLHSLVTIMVYLFVGHLVKNKFYSFLGAMVFALHPVQTQPIAWIAGRNDLLLGLFGLMTIMFYHYYSIRGGNKFIVLSVLCFIAALATKEQGIFIILLIPLYELLTRRVKLKDLFSKKTLIVIIIYAIAIVSYFFVRYLVFGSVFDGAKYFIVEPLLRRIVAAPVIIATYLQLVFVPYNLSLVHTVKVPGSMLDISFLLGLSIVIIVLFLIIVFWKKYPVLVFGLTWLFLFILPSSNIIPIPIPILEHRLYLPMIGFAICTSAFMHEFANMIRAQKIIYYFAVLTVVLYGILGFIRLPVWANTETIWNDAIKSNPDNDLPYYNLGTYYVSKSQYIKGIEYLENATRTNEKAQDVFQNLGFAYTQLNRFEDAAVAYERANRIDPKSSVTCLGLGNAYRSVNRYSESSRIYKEGIRWNHNSVPLHYEYGLLCGLMRNDSLAEIELKKTISLDTKYAPAYFSLGAMYSFQNKDREAIAFITEGMKYQTPAADIYYVLGKSYNNIGDTLKAKYYYNIYRSSRQ
jgi:tetratricopeptide (TPR) repeat protein